MRRVSLSLSSHAFPIGRAPAGWRRYGGENFAVGTAGEGRENEIWHFVERAWSIQVHRRPDGEFYGTVDLDWRFAGARPEAVTASRGV